MAQQFVFSWLQFLAVVLAGAIFYNAYMLYKKGKFARKDYWSWGGFSLLLVIGAVIPTFFPFLLGFFTGRALDTLLIVGLLVSFGLNFQVYVRLQQTNKEVTDLVRKVAIKFEEYEKTKKSKRK